MLGTAAVAMWWDIAPQMQAEFEEWHTREHMPERLAIPGFLRGTRWISVSGEPRYFVLYEVTEAATLTGKAYLDRLNHPTPWSRRMMPHHRNMVRSLCRVRASYGGLLGQALAAIQLSAAPQALPARAGLAGAHLLESQPMPAAQTAEQKIRGADASTNWVLLVSGDDASAVDAAVGGGAALYRPAHTLSPQGL